MLVDLPGHSSRRQVRLRWLAIEYWFTYREHQGQSSEFWVETSVNATRIAGCEATSPENPLHEDIVQSAVRRLSAIVGPLLLPGATIFDFSPIDNGTALIFVNTC
jgi:hypothetical protein